MDDVLKKKIENKQKSISTKEDLSKNGYAKSGKTPSGFLWVNIEYRKKEGRLHRERKKAGIAQRCVVDGKLTSWNRGLSNKTDNRLNDAWNKGQTDVYSDETLKMMSENRKGTSSWNKGLTMETNNRVKNGWSKGLTPETDERVKRWCDAGHNANRGKPSWNKDLTKNTDERLRKSGEKISKQKKGVPSWNKGFTQESDERVKKMSESKRTRLDKEPIIKKYLTEEKNMDVVASELGVCRSTIKKEMFRHGISILSRSVTSKRAWADEDFRKESLKRLARAAGLASPTSYEQKVIDVCEEFGLPFEFVGDGKMVIESKIPDFVATNGEKLIIESYCKFWHADDYEVTRSKFLNEHGYEVLFLDDNDLCAKEWKEICKMKIEKFMEEEKNG